MAPSEFRLAESSHAFALAWAFADGAPWAASRSSSQASAVASLTQNRASTTMIWLTVALTILTGVLLALTVVLVLDGSSSDNKPINPTPTQQSSVIFRSIA